MIIGTAFGLAVNLGGIINGGATLFCASGTGIYGSLDSGHGACDAGELVLGKYDRTDAVIEKHP